MAALFEVDDPDELHALEIALSDAKFKPFPDSRPHLGDPLVARLCERVVEARVAAQAAGVLPSNPDQTQAYYGGRPPDWIWAVIRRGLAEATRLPVWAEWSSQQRADYVRLLLSPFAATNNIVTELLADGSEEQVQAITNAEELDRYLEKELSYCGCAGGHEAVELLRDVLRIIRDSDRELATVGPSEAWKQAYRQLMARVCYDTVPGLATWFLYMLDGREIINHGFNVTQCSTTPKGIRLLDAIELYYEPPEE